jgi:hypothetical protein
MRRRIQYNELHQQMSVQLNEEEDTCMSYEEEDTIQ